MIDFEGSNLIIFRYTIVSAKKSYNVRIYTSSRNCIPVVPSSQTFLSFNIKTPLVFQ